MSRRTYLCFFILLLSTSCLAVDYCKVTDLRTGDTYDFSPLTKTVGLNWRVDTEQYVYLLNICNNLLPQSISVQTTVKACDSTTEGCQIDNVSPNASAKRLGTNPTLKVKDVGEVELRLAGGDYCLTQKANRSVSILFHCNKNNGIGSPKYIEEDDGCLYIFEWETSYACPKKAPTLQPPVEPTDCMIVDTATKLRYDLTALSLPYSNWVVRDYEYEYLINICADVRNIPECAGHSACQTKPTDSTFIKQMGLSTGRPVIEDGVLKLKLTGGKSCHGGDSLRQTTIIFTCLEGESLGTPEFLEETDDCMYIFSWETSAACPESTTPTCSARDPATKKYADLSSLVRKEGEKNYIAPSAMPGDSAKYEVNICAGLIGTDHGCREGTSICQTPVGSTVGRSLGNVGTLFAMNGDVVMRYSDGDLCPGTLNTRVTTDIYFICDENALLNAIPRLLSSKNDCQYLFNWKTPAACETTQNPDEVPTAAPKKGLNGGAIAAIVIFSVIIAYFIGGIAYNRFVKGQKGTDQIPHYGLFQVVYYTIAERCSRLKQPTGSIQL